MHSREKGKTRGRGLQKEIVGKKSKLINTKKSGCLQFLRLKRGEVSDGE